MIRFLIEPKGVKEKDGVASSRKPLWTVRGDPAFSCVDVRLAGDTPMVRGEKTA